MKILIVGDIHIDGNWTEDTDEVLSKITGFAYGCEKVILLGDIYHRRDVQKGGKEEARFHRFLGSLPREAEIHILTGNHDLSDERNLLAEVKTFPFIQRIYLYDELSIPFSIGDKLAVMLPWEVHRRTDTVEWFKSKCEYLKTLNEKFILFAHLPLIEAKFNNTKMISNQAKNFPSVKLLEAIPNFEFAFLGDIHLPQDVGHRAIYVGGIRNINFAENGDKRVILFDTDKMVGTNLWLGCRDTYMADIKMADLKGLLLDPILTNKMVKLKVHCTQEEYERGIELIDHKAYDLKIDYEIQGKKEFKSLDITDDDRMFYMYCDTLSGKYGVNIIDKVKIIGRDIING